VLYDVPWDAIATLTCVNEVSGIRDEIGSGSLRSILHDVARHSWIDRKHLRIVFKQRQDAPFGYGPENFNDLIRLAQDESGSAQ